MRYRVLRNCYVGDRYYAEGHIYDLPDTMEKSPKNFEPLEKQVLKTEVEEIPAETVLPPENQTVEPLEVSSEEPPLYVPDKPPRPKKKRRKINGN